MFCPNCGANNKIEQKFCRFCRLNLLETNESLAAQFSSGQNAGQLKKLERIKKVSDFVSIGLTVAIAGGALIYIYTRLTNSAFPGGKIFLAFIIIFAIIESFLLYIRRANTLGYADETDIKSALAQNELEKRETAKLLEVKPFEPASSVTENSTELLFIENKTNKLE